MSKQAIQRLYSLDHPPHLAEVLRRAQPWRPFPMWALVLLHVWFRGEGGGPAPARGRGRRGAERS